MHSEKPVVAGLRDPKTPLSARDDIERSGVAYRMRLPSQSIALQRSWISIVRYNTPSDTKIHSDTCPCARLFENYPFGNVRF